MCSNLCSAARSQRTIIAQQTDSRVQSGECEATVENKYRLVTIVFSPFQPRCLAVMRQSERAFGSLDEDKNWLDWVYACLCVLFLCAQDQWSGSEATQHLASWGCNQSQLIRLHFMHFWNRLESQVTCFLVIHFLSYSLPQTRALSFRSGVLSWLKRDIGIATIVCCHTMQRKAGVESKSFNPIKAESYYQ